MLRYCFTGEGRIISYTIVHDGMPNYSNQVPYILAMIILDEGDMVLGQIVDCDPSEVEIDDRVELVFRKLSAEGSSGTIQYGYKFRIKTGV
jgi:hypothetical protein